MKAYISEILYDGGFQLGWFFPKGYLAMYGNIFLVVITGETEVYYWHLIGTERPGI
jgi:hypothetical protein